MDGLRGDRRVAPLLAFFLAGAVSLYLALQLAPTGDEFHTLSHLHHGSFADFWAAYRLKRDTLPPAGYLVSWVLAGGFGTSIFTARLPMVFAWASAAAVIAVVLERHGRRAALTGALVPTASALVLLGSFARPYAFVFCAFAFAALAWQRSFGSTSPRRCAVVLALSLAVATTLHYLSAAVIVAFVVAELLVARTERRPRSVLVGLGVAVLPLVASIPLLPRAVEDQRRIPGDTGIDQVPRYFLSVSRPLWPTIVVTCCLGLWLWQRRRGRASPVRPVSLAPDDFLALSLTVVVPVLSVLGMRLTSGVYLHRYALGGLLGLSLLVGSGLGRLSRGSNGSSRLVTAISALVVLSVPYAVHQVLGDHLLVSEARVLAEQLDLPVGEAGEQIIATESYAFLILREYADPAIASRLALGGPATFAGTEDDVVAWRSTFRSAEQAGVDVHVVGSPPLEWLSAEAGPGWSMSVVSRATYTATGRERDVAHVVLRPPRS